MLEIRQLLAKAGSFVLGEISLNVGTNECHAVLGPSGSGKTTLLRAVLGLTPITGGCIFLNGTDITNTPVESRGLGYVPQDLGLFPHMSVNDNLMYGARVRHQKSTDYAALFDRLTEATGLHPLLQRKPETLSGGERQRVALVRALLSGPRIVLFDEPFGALNESLRREMWWLVRELRREFGFSTLLVTHDLAEAHFLADRISVLVDGRIVQQGEKNEVFTRPVATQVAQLLGVETLQRGRILDVTEGLATVEVNGTQLTALAPPCDTREVLICIRAQEVILQRDDSAHESARNRLAGKVIAIHEGWPLYRVEVDVGFSLSAMVTHAACEELALRPGAPVTALIKAPAVHLIPLRQPMP